MLERRSGEEDGGGSIDRWVEEHHRKHEMETRHPFILSIRGGTVEISSFKRWLRQDYIFVKEFVPFVASVLLKASKDSDDENDVEIILRGLASLHDELSWFRKEAAKWDISLINVAPQKANQDYCRFLQSLTLPEVDYTTAIVAFWAVESVYQESFSLCLDEGSNTPPELMDTCQRWGNAGFGQYCRTLKKIANRCLEKASGNVVKKAEESLLIVLEHEVNFWNISTGEN